MASAAERVVEATAQRARAEATAAAAETARVAAEARAEGAAAELANAEDRAAKVSSALSAERARALAVEATSGRNLTRALAQAAAAVGTQAKLEVALDELRDQAALREQQVRRLHAGYKPVTSRSVQQVVPVARGVRSAARRGSRVCEVEPL